MRNRKLLTLALLLPLVLITGCASTTTPGTSATDGLGHLTACPAGDQIDPFGTTNRSLSPLPTGFTASAAIMCSLENRTVAGGAVWSVVVERRATAGLDALVSALGRTDEPTPPNQSCTAMLVGLPWFALVDSQGNWFRPRTPLDSCGQPQAVVLSALRALSWTEVSATPYQQVQSPAEASLAAAAAALGCPNDFKDMISIESSTNGSPPGSAKIDPTPSDAYSVCHFVSTPDSGGMRILHFTAGRRVTGAAATALTEALQASAQLAACTAQHRTVTGVFAATGAWILVEDDGCRRVLDGQTSGWGQATATLQSLLR